ncbi:MAG: hypothetical protein ACXWZB_09350 [Gaiellaceae bacterium]
MYELASGAAAPVAVGLVGSAEPPLTPEPVGPAPSNFEAPAVPLRSFETILAEHTAAAPAAVADPAEIRRLVIRLLGGDQVELGGYDDREQAVAAARELMTSFSTAEANGEWPELDGRFIRPGSVASIDVLAAD